MVRPCVFLLLAIALCPISCLCTETTYNKTKVEKAVNEAKESINKFWNGTEERINCARSTVGDLKRYRENEKIVIVYLQNIANENEVAKAIAQQTNKASEDFLKRYSTHFAAAEKVVNDSHELLLAENGLEEIASILQSNKDGQEKYNDLNAKADNIEAKAKVFEESIKNKDLLCTDSSPLRNDLEQNIKETQLAKYLIYTILTLDQIEKSLNSPDSYIHRTVGKTDALNDILNDVKELYNKLPLVFTKRIHSSHSSTEVNVQLTAIMVEEAANTTMCIMELQKAAEGAFAGDKSAITKSEASTDVTSDNAFAKEVLNIIQKLKTLLNDAESAAAKAAAEMKEVAEKELEKKNKLENAQTKNTEEPHMPLNKGTEILQKTGGTEPMILNPEKPKLCTQEQSINEARDQSKAKNEEILNMEKVHQAVEGKTKRSVVDGQENTLGVIGDTAVTVSVSLLLALIACAAMH